MTTPSRWVGSRLSPSHEAGNAVVEFTWLAILLMVPLVYLILAVFSVQRSAYGITQATREAGRAFVSAGTTQDGIANARAAAWLAMRDQGIELGPNDLRIECSPSPCALSPRTVVHVRIDTAVDLPFLPRMFGRPLVPIHARHDTVVDTYRAVAR